MTDQSFPASHRVLRQADFDRVYQFDVFAADQMLVVKGAPNGLSHPRLGLSVSRAVGNAVVRNRWKRLIREAFRRSKNELPTGIDLVVRPKRGATPDADAIRESLARLATKLSRQIARGRR